MPRPIGYKVTNETKEKIRTKLLGIKHTDSRRMNISLAKRGKTAWNKGVGKRTTLTQMIRSSSLYFEWRRLIFSRDKYTCILCGDKGGWNKLKQKRIILCADHIKAFSRILTEKSVLNLDDAFTCSDLWDISNGRTLCVDCHKKTDNFGTKARK